MAAYAASGRTTVAASPQQCFDLLTDYEHLVDWQGSLKRVEVIERDAAGATVEYVLDAKVREVKYRLRLEHHPPGRLVSTYVSGDFRDLSAEWRFTQTAEATTIVELQLQLEPGWRIPGPIRAIVQSVVMSRAMNDLKVRVEAG
jgi:ribosome-associated toxin RatA of RatAB toxin-antitoxin module